MVTATRSSSAEAGSRVLSGFAVVAASVAAGALLLPEPLADVFFAGWVVGSVGLTLLGALGAWTNRSPLVWVAALLLTGLSIVGMWSIGLFIAPAALCLLGAAVLSQWAGPRPGVREAIVAEPPTVRETVLKALAGTGAVAAGTGLVYVGAIARDLFGACASETLACALASTHWDAVGLTILGLLTAGFGGWLLWRQVYIGRVLAANQTG